MIVASVPAPMFGNVMSFGQLKEKLIQAFTELESILSSHSGPFAASCVIGSKWRQSNDVDEFTKDGIKILKHLIVSEDPAARFAARLVRFVGIAVDKRCHDGTTTSMLLTCKLARIALSAMDLDLNDLDRNRHGWAIAQVLEKCLAYLSSNKITEDDILKRCAELGIETDLPEVRGAIAFHMAMISSKGDADLAEKVSYVVRSSPKKIYGIFQNTALAIETEERYILKKQDHDLAMNATLGILQDYNYKSNTQYRTENAVIFATPNDIVNDSMESIFLQAFISTDARQRANLDDFGMEHGWEHYHQDIKHLVIMTPMLNDPNLIASILKFNKANPEIKISWFNVQIHQRLRTSLDETLHFMAGKYQFTKSMEDVERSLIGLDRPVTVHLIGNVITVTGLYEKTGAVFHPYYDDPEAFPPYTRYLAEKEELIEFANANISNPGLESEEVTYLTALYRAATTQNIYEIEVGGTAHDQYANRTVYEDAMGAALSAVSEGVVFGGYGHLAKFCFSQDDAPGGVIYDIGEVIIDLIEDSLRLKGENRASIITAHATKWNYLAADINAVKTGGSSTDYLSVKEIDEIGMKKFLAKDASETVLIQAYGGFDEQLKRCLSFIPRLATTVNLADMRISDAESVR